MSLPLCRRTGHSTTFASFYWRRTGRPPIFGSAGFRNRCAGRPLRPPPGPAYESSVYYLSQNLAFSKDKTIADLPRAFLSIILETRFGPRQHSALLFRRLEHPSGISRFPLASSKDKTTADLLKSVFINNLGNMFRTKATFSTFIPPHGLVGYCLRIKFTLAKDRTVIVVPR